MHYAGREVPSGRRTAGLDFVDRNLVLTIIQVIDIIKENGAPRIEVEGPRDQKDGDQAMAICEYVNCKGNYRPTKNWQRFCSPKCRDDWHNHQRKIAQMQEAERLRELRLANANGANGASNPKPLSEIMQARRTVEPLPPMRRLIA